jgi:hypothetical protein
MSKLARASALVCLPLALALGACAAETAPDAPGAPVADEADYTGGTKLLDCSVFLSGGGPDQQVTVRRTSKGLVLEELTNHGSMVSRPLAAAEWTSKSLRLRADPDDFGRGKAKLFHDAKEKAWMYSYASPGWAADGYADCQ